MVRSLLAMLAAGLLLAACAEGARRDNGGADRRHKPDFGSAVVTGKTVRGR